MVSISPARCGREFPKACETTASAFPNADALTDNYELDFENVILPVPEMPIPKGFPDNSTVISNCDT